MSATRLPPAQTAEPVPAPVRKRRPVWSRVLASPIAGTSVALIAVCGVLAAIAPDFATVGNVLNILLAASTLTVLACGLTVALIAGEIDLSVGSVEALTGSVAAVMIVTYGIPWPLAIVGGIAAGAAAGFVNGLFLTRFAVPSFVASLAMLSIASGAANLLTNGTSVFGLGSQFGFLGTGKVFGIPVPVLIAAVVAVVLAVTLRRTSFGLDVYAVGGNREAARLSGVGIASIKIKVLVLSGALAGLAGLIIAARLDSGSGTVGTQDLMAAIAAVVIGGTSLNGGVGSIGGSVVGALLIATIQNGLVLMNITAFWQQVAIGSLILIAALLERLSRLTLGGKPA
ncbi:monosaccharide ABC transporter membrane protein (CUT2 family) [Amycolatopsis sulphurea]|uniref:Monosaccharide ABC transporter membrane protein (CUT2 family) n=1 Tax=Amycolatopsis sulphurea TaxID=76022 RepID=A0A2A9FJP0_9PSEU|nr:ABC transporter permease [Amycolatopsis sulphurea]PFG50669.1 monosaccharide ABC transporter membrane protein (CUT2 family) [Amycolatopsis sulphurea]